MAILAIGSVALDSVETSDAAVERVVGGSAVFFCAAASLLENVHVVAVVGDDYPLDQLRFLEARGTDLGGLTQIPGESFFWAGRYSEGFRTRETTETRLGVFGSFDPRIPAAYRSSPFVFLGNIDPVLQLGVLDQVRSPALVAADTMNFWIERSIEPLLAVLARLDALFVNDEEAMQLAQVDELGSAARWIMDRGPGMVVVKLGEDGAVVFSRDWTLSCPGYQVSRVVDPTGAGDAFAGGFMGFLARTGSWRREDLAGALAHGAAMGSFAVESFSIDRFRDLLLDEVNARAGVLAGMTTIAEELALTRAIPGGHR